MKIFKRLLIVCIIMLTVFLASCKKCGKNKEENAGGSGNGGSTSSLSLSVDSEGNLNFKAPSKTDLSGSKNDVTLECLKITYTVNYPSKSVETCNSEAQSALNEWINEESLDANMKYVFPTLENSGVSLSQLKSLTKLVQENKNLIVCAIDWYEDGDTTIFEDNYDQVKNVLKEIKNMFTVEQLGMALTYAEMESLFEDGDEYHFNNLYGETIVKTFSELTSMFSGKMSFIKDAGESEYRDYYFQLSTAAATLAYRVIDVLLETDKETVKQAAKAFRYLESENYESLAINLKENINSIVTITKKLLSKISDNDIKIILSQKMVMNNIRHLESSIYIEEYCIPVDLGSNEWYLARPLITLAVDVLSDENVVDKICEYVETLVDKYSDNVAMNLGMYVAEQVVAGYEKLSKKDREMLNEAAEKLFPDTFEYSFDKLLETVKPILKNSEYDNEQKIEEFVNAIDADIRNADKGGVYVRPCYRVYDCLIVEKGTTKEVLKERIFINYDIYYSNGNGNYSYLDSDNLDVVTVKSYDTNTLGYQTAVLSYNSYEFEVTYYVCDYYKNLLMAAVPVFECYVLQGQPNTVLEYNYGFSISPDYWIEELKLEVYPYIYFDASDVTLYNVDVSYPHSGIGYAVIKTDRSNCGEIIVPVNYHVLTKDKEVVTGMWASFNYSLLHNENITKELVVENTSYFEIYYMEVAQDDYGNYTKLDTGWKYVDLTVENITNIVIYEDYIEIEVTYENYARSFRVWKY